MDKQKAVVKYVGAGLAVVTGALVIAEAPILCIGAAVGGYVYYKVSKA